LKLLCLDTETGGLNAQTDALVEVAWCDPSDPNGARSLVLPHDFEDVTPQAAEVNGYKARGLADPFNWATYDEIADFKSALKGATLIGANIAFDENFLAANGFSGWHYRKIDLESMALPLVGFVHDHRTDSLKVPGLANVTDALRRRGYGIPEPDHTALGDVRTTVAAYNALTLEYAGMMP
jgi:DNA polymerase III epsilon subunit-like protein